MSLHDEVIHDLHSWQNFPTAKEHEEELWEEIKSNPRIKQGMKVAVYASDEWHEGDFCGFARVTGMPMWDDEDITHYVQVMMYSGKIFMMDICQLKEIIHYRSEMRSCLNLIEGGKC